MDNTRIQLYREKLGKLGVELLIAFGSRIEGGARADSDFDVGVVFENDTLQVQRRYGTLYATVQEFLPKERIELVDLNKAPYPLQFRV